MLNPTLGIWLTRDPAADAPPQELVYSHDYVARRIREILAGSKGQYSDGMNLYAAYFVPNGVDPLGMGVAITTLPGTLEGGAISGACKAEATRIGQAIGNTFSNNWRFRYPRFRDERNKGYYCYEWAYAFEDAFNLESSGNCFSVAVESASTDDGRVHYWIVIRSKEDPNVKVYVDDGFADGDYVHSSRPIPKGWDLGNPTGDRPRSNCSPPPPYDCKNKKS